MSIYSSAKNGINGVGEVLKESRDSLKRLYKDFRNQTSIKPHTLERYGIKKPTNKEILDALTTFHDNQNYQNEKTKINKLLTNEELPQWKREQEKRKASKHLLETLNNKGFPIDIQKIENIYNEVSYKIEGIRNNIEKDDNNENLSEKDIERQITTSLEIQKILDNLSSEDIFNIIYYALNIKFWKDQINDGKSLKDLTIVDLHKTKISDLGPCPQKPNKKDSSCKEYISTLNTRIKELIKRKNNNENLKNRSCDIKLQEEISQLFADFGRAKHLPSGILKILSNLAVLLTGKGAQNIIEFKFTPELLEMSPEEEREIRHIIQDLQYGENFFIIVNHETFANIPIAILKFMKVAEQEGIENINKHLWTIIGSYILTNRKERAQLSAISNIIPTIPATNEIPGTASLTKQIRENATNQIIKVFSDSKQKSQGKVTKHKKRFSKKLQKKQGHIIFCAPSGTRDVIHRTPSGKNFVFMPDGSQKSNRTTFMLMKRLKELDVRIISLSTNTSDMKKPNKKNGVTTNNSQYNNGIPVAMSITEIDMDDSNIKSSGDVVNILASGVKYPKSFIMSDSGEATPIYQEYPCGIPIPNDIFLYIKSETKKDYYANTGRLNPELFIDEEKGELNFNLIRQKIDEDKAKKQKEKEADLQNV